MQNHMKTDNPIPTWNALWGPCTRSAKIYCFRTLSYTVLFSYQLSMWLKTYCWAISGISVCNRHGLELTCTGSDVTHMIGRILCCRQILCFIRFGLSKSNEYQPSFNSECLFSIFMFRCPKYGSIRLSPLTEFIYR